MTTNQPQKEPLEQLHVRLPLAMKRAAEREAAKLGVPVAAVVKMALSERYEMGRGEHEKAS